MKHGLAEGLFWTAIGLVGGSFVLGGLGVEMSPGPAAELLLQWHKAFGLLSLVAWLAAVAAFVAGGRRLSVPLRRWPAPLRATILTLLYMLLILQPVSGWFLASLEGKLASVFGWSLPPLAEPSDVLANYVLTYHMLGAGLILIIAAWTLRLNWEIYALGPLARLRRRQLARTEARSRAGASGPKA
ncbi:MAG TPA: cytochrome b/b6 domain-containing protein [Roseiarcus sp.]|nr:cytochrome b/b6 domain-containing protein [Roseiarcus sp.]